MAYSADRMSACYDGATMKIPDRLPTSVLAFLCAAALAGCAGAASSETRAGAIPVTGASSAQLPAAGGVRRTSSLPGCSGANGEYAFYGAGDANFVPANYGVVVGGIGNDDCDGFTALVGGAYNVIKVGGTDAYSFLGGGYENGIIGSGYASFIGDGFQNTNSGGYASIVGGKTNSVSAAATYGLVGGGTANTLSGEYGVIGGGLDNNVSGEGGYIAAGGYNMLSGTGAVIDGGFNNAAAGNFGTVPGGYVNSAGGVYSFAAGARASAGQTGTFVWSDGSDGDTILTSAHAYQFLARASGGYTLWTNAASTVGATLAAGSGTWASASDRNMKTNIALVDDAAVLDKVARLPISRWSYISEHGVRHVGPMAQDFYAAFGVGEDDKHITSIDEDGVALAAIKALHAENAALHTENTSLRAELTATTRTQSVQIAALKASEVERDRRLERLSAIVTALRKR
jgi:hypothetical protein